LYRKSYFPAEFFNILDILKTGIDQTVQKRIKSKDKERLLLILKVEGEGMLPAHAADELHRSRPCALYWLEGFSNEGIDGLKDRSKSGRPPEIPKELAISIRKKPLESKQGWTTTKQVRNIIFREGWSKISPYSHLQEYFTSGVSNRRYQEKCTSEKLARIIVLF
jgi:putative transposase